MHQGEFLSYHLNGLINRVVSVPSIDSLNIFFNNTGFAGRIFAGYQFNAYFAAEMGYYRFSPLNIKADFNVDVVILEKFDLSVPFDFTARATVYTYVVDLVGKGIYPVTDKFSLYGKLGVAYLNATGNIILAVKTKIVDLSISTNPSINVLYPTFGIGLNYDITQHFSTDLSWSHIQKYNSHCFPSVDFVGVGLLYHF